MKEAERALEEVLRVDEGLEEAEDPLYVESVAPRDFSPVKPLKPSIKLPPPAGLDMPFIEVIRRRRSRPPGREPLELGAVASVLYAAAGLTGAEDGVYGRLDYPFRASPSAGGLHCVDVYLLALRVGGLEPGVYYYHYVEHGLAPLCSPCYPHSAMESLTQEAYRDAPAALVLVADLRRGLWKYGERFYKFCLVDVGVVAENAHLAATALGLASVLVAGFLRQRMAEALGLARGELPVLMVVLGHVGR